MKIKYLGHSCFEIRTLNATLLVDPFISGNKKMESFDLESLRPDFILLTHGHGDHVGDTVQIAKSCNAHVISNHEVTTWLQEQGLYGDDMNHGGMKEFPFGTLKYVNAVHSSTLPDGSPGGNPGGFVIWNKEGCIYIAGDTALTFDMQLIPMTCPPLNVAILPVGDYFTMGYRDALIASNFVQCDRVIGCHFDTFDPIKIDHKMAVEYFRHEGKELILMEIGQEMEI